MRIVTEGAQRSELAKLGVLLKPFLVFVVFVLAVLTLFRMSLVAWQWQRVMSADMLGPIMVQGLRFDLVLLGMCLAIPVLLFPFFVSHGKGVSAWQPFVRTYLLVSTLLITFMECATPSFIQQFDARPNLLFIEYLNHPLEVASTLIATQKLPLSLAIVICGLVGWKLRNRFKSVEKIRNPLRIRMVLWCTPLMLLVCVALIRSSFEHRPVNPSTVALSSDPMVNDLALNSSYTALYAAYEMTREPGQASNYGAMAADQVVRVVQDQMQLPAASFVSKQLPTLHQQRATRKHARPLNLVIILEESLGAEFVGSLGGLPLTPNLDELAKQGIWLENLYATGTRSVRGIEAVITGFTPSPALSVVKLGKSQKNFFTLAQLLAQQGYQTSFIYGGDAQFDNMGRFFMNNGFQRIIDQDDYSNPLFTGSWGVSDEDLFDRAHEEFLRAGDQPFFSLVFSSSNHSPFEFPERGIALYDREKHTVNNAVKYADYALGRFIERARNSGYWDNTVFLIVADHNSRVRGAELVPINNFHIPGLILGDTIAPMMIKTTASQIDLAPTLLSLIGVSATHPMIGHDLTRPEIRAQPGRAIMQYNATQAYLEGDQVAILRKGLPISEFTYQANKLVPVQAKNSVLEKTALAHANWSSMAYAEKLYRLP